MRSILRVRAIYTALFVLAIFSIAISAIGGCSASPGVAPSPPGPELGKANGSHTIKVFAKGADGSSTLLQFGPGTEVYFGGTYAGSLSTTSGAFGPDGGVLTTQSLTPTSGLQFQANEGGVPLVTPPSVESPGTGLDPWSTAWALVWKAAGLCGGQVGTTNLPWHGLQDPGGAWYVYATDVVRDCSDRLQLQQNLVCVADMLGQVADAVGTVVWAASASGPDLVYGSDAGDTSALRYAEWDIPPQADSDRFIVRDLAIHTLAMIPTIDAFTDIQFPAPIPTSVRTCAQAFSWVAGANPSTLGACGSSSLAGVSEAVFGFAPTYTESNGSTGYVTPAFPPSAAPVCDAEGNDSAPAIAGSAIDIEAQILRSGGRLLHDLIRRDVYSDMAAAAQQSAQALNPVLGNQTAWGESSQGPYGSIAHAARVLVGRWELGDSQDFGTVADPQCEGTPEISLIPTAFGNDLSARVLDLPLQTAGEQTAAQLVERSGIVIPTCELPTGNGSASSLKPALVDQLLLQEQLQNHLPSRPPATALQNVVNQLADDEVTFAFARALNTWRLLTDSADTTADGGEPDGGTGPCAAVAADPSGTAQVAGLTVNVGSNPALSPLVAQLSGVVVQGGLARSRLVTDPMARAGGMTEASQCADSNQYWDEWGTDETATLLIPNEDVGPPPERLSEPPGATLPPGVFQDAFHVGQALERRLNLLQTAAASLSYTDPANVARGGIAELRTWAGSTIVHAWPTGISGPTAGPSATDAPPITSFTVRVGGMSYANDFFIASGAPITSVQNAFGFVYGPPWVAECAAGVRPNCPTNFAQNYIQMAIGVTDVTSSYASTGVLDNVFELTVPLGGAPQFQPPTDTAPSVSESHLYMVRLHDPTDPLGNGHVMGTLPLRGQWLRRRGGTTPSWLFTYSISGFVDAPMQRELVHDAIDLGQWVGAKPPALGDPSAAATSGYCVDGVPLNLFVPLDNELISGTNTYEDSWQNYLNLAQQAAQTADTLGQQLIANDLLISENQQAAAEQLANICGDFGALSTATVQTDGTITAGTEDPTTQECLSEPITDVVFIGSLPPTINAAVMAGADPTCATKAAIHCSQADLQTSGCATGGTAPATTPYPTALCQKTKLTVDTLGVALPSGPSTSSGTTNPSGGCAQNKSLLSCACNDMFAPGASVSTSLRGTGLAGSSFLQDLSDPSLNAGAMQSVADQMKMSVGLTNHWQVTYGSASQIIMDSVDVRYWPACLNSNFCNNVGSGGLGGPSAVQAAMAPAWSTVFRDCPNPTDNFGALGCDAGGSAATELNAIKWRVTQAMWMIGASAGAIPAGMFALPIPAIFTDWCANCSTQSYFPVGWPTFYLGTVVNASVSPFSQCDNLTNNCQMLSTSDPNTSAADVSTVGPIFGVNPAFGLFEVAASNEIPSWYREIYSANSPYQTYQPGPLVTHILASNASVVFPQCNDEFGQQCPSMGNGAPNPTLAPVSLSTLVGNATHFNGFGCSRFFGEPSSGPTPQDTVASQAWWITVAEVKTGMSNAGPGPGGWAPQYQSAGWDPSDPTWSLPLNAGSAGYSASQSTWELGPYGTSPMSPSAVPPPERASLYLGSNAEPNGTCGAVALLLQAAALACTPSPSQPVNLSPTSPPAINDLSDVPTLEAWLGLASTTLYNLVGGLYAQEIPSRVVQDFKNHTVGSGSLGGTKGQAILTTELNIQSFPATWTEIAADLSQIQGDIRIANNAITAAGLQQDTADGTLALQQIGIQGNMAQATAQFIATVVSAAANSVTTLGASNEADPIAALALSNQLTTDNQELTQLQDLENTASQTEQNQVSQALAQLAQSTQPLWADIQSKIDALRADVAQIDANAQTVIQSQNEAAYQAAIGTGQDFVNIANQEVPIPVNTVLRRQASATEQRYQAALTNAKALAYMARRAIEQRIGVPLDALTQQVGPLDPPAAWADDICSLQGVNYAALSTATPATGADGGEIDGGGIGGAADLQAINQFADAWVGDYVTKLQNFVTYYNVQYPSHQGDDTAILSLRYDLLGPVSQCSVQAPNMLLNSGDLTAQGWQATSCAVSSGECVAAIGGYALAAPQSGPWGAQGSEGGLSTDLPSFAVSGITWLLDVSPSSADGGSPGGNFGSDAGAVSPGTGNANLDAGATSGWPQNLVVQQVLLQAGSYVLSWWDQARDANGNVVWAGGATPVPYVAQVFDPSWSAIAVYDEAPYTPPEVGDAGSPALWSSRHALAFTVANTGTYAVAFGASNIGGGSGSVAIADVQLELAAANGQPTTYVATSSTTMVPGLNCPMSDSDLRSSFTHNCDNTGVCSYDLSVPFIIDTTAIGGGTPLGAKLADGNYNYRHIDLALNLVGTNVHDCANDPDPNCYSSAYVQYDLQHDGTSAGIIGYDGNSRTFDFGLASVNHGKALAAERYITMPISSDDQQLISQPGIQHIEFGGRPLDGTYYLRIWDSPDLNWSALQDVQIILDYEYWSQIQNSLGSMRRPGPPHGVYSPHVRPIIRASISRP